MRTLDLRLVVRLFNKQNRSTDDMGLRKFFCCMLSETSVGTHIDPAALLRLKQVLRLVPVSPSTWWAGVRTGRFPGALKLGPKTTVWRASDIFALIERATGGNKR